MGLQVNGHSIPWTIVLFAIAIVSSSAVTVYQVKILQSSQDKHEALEGHPGIDKRLSIMEESNRHETRRLDAIEDRQKNLSHRLRILENARLDESP